MITLLKSGEVYAPDYLGQKDILTAGGKIAAIEDNIELPNSFNDHIEVYDAAGKILIPGLIDGHVHITGGGGEGSFKTRTPELMFSDCIKGGITTVVGVIGTDGSTRTMTNLIAKAKGLTEEGITCYCLSGNYHVPVKTVTGSVETDIILIHEVIGTGEIAIADHRSSQPALQELARLSSESRIGGLLAGKGGAVVVHVGDSRQRLTLLEELVEKTDIPISQFIPTHINRNRELLKAGIEYGKRGGYIDLTTSSVHGEDNELSSSKCLKKLLDSGVDISRISFTSDGQGSLPKFNSHGELTGMEVGRVTSLFQEVRNAFLKEGVTMEDAVRTATSNPAEMLKLTEKGRIEAGKDADFALLDRTDYSVSGVIALGKWMMKEKEIIKKGTFE